MCEGVCVGEVNVSVPVLISYVHMLFNTKQRICIMSFLYTPYSWCCKL